MEGVRYRERCDGGSQQEHGAWFHLVSGPREARCADGAWCQRVQAVEAAQAKEMAMVVVVVPRCLHTAYLSRRGPHQRGKGGPPLLG